MNAKRNTSRDKPLIRRCGGRPTLRARAGFTLIELLVTVAVIVIALGVATLSFSRVTQATALVTAANTISSQVAFARSYAINNQIETMLVVNPYNGRLEIWHLNPPPRGGPWDPYSRGDGTVNTPNNALPDYRPPYTNGYAFAPVLNASVALPLDSNGVPLVAVFPYDFDATIGAGGAPLRVNSLTAPSDTRQNRDSLNWVALCFDSQGRMVQRARRVATRSKFDESYFGVVPNRRIDGTPDTLFLPAQLVPGGTANDGNKYVVDIRDSLITSTNGFIVTDRKRMEQVLRTTSPTPLQLLEPNTGWLPRTRPGGDLASFAQQVILNPWSGAELALVE